MPLVVTEVVRGVNSALDIEERSELCPSSFSKYGDGLRQSTAAFTARINERLCLYGRDMSRPFQQREFPTRVRHYVLRTLADWVVFGVIDIAARVRSEGREKSRTASQFASG